MFTSKYQPEFYKPYKPENNSGCCPCSRKKVEEVSIPQVRRYCYIRYDSCQRPTICS